MLFILGGCNVTSDRSDKPSPDWSRGLRIGVASLNQPVALQVDREGHAHLVWHAGAEEVSKLHYAQLDDQARVVVEKDLDILLPYPHRPQLLLDRRGNMHLACLAREEGVKRLFHFLLDHDGEVLSETTNYTRLSLPGKEVESYLMRLGQGGQIEVFWAAKEGIYHLRLDEQGDVISPSTLIVPQGTDPSAQVDSSGTIHLAWLQEPSPQVKELYHAAFKSPDLVKGIKLTQFSKGMSVVLHGPVLGLDMGYVYILWSLERRGGLEVGTARSYYVSFPLGQPSLRLRSGQAPLAPTLIRIPRLEPVYTPSRGEDNYHQLAYPLEKWASDFIAMPSVAEGQRNELAATFNVQVSFGLQAYLEESKTAAIGPEEVPLSIGFRPQIQLAMAIFTKGKMKGYQLAAKTGSVSLRPNLVVDTATTNNLHLAWIDTAGFGRYDVYYASSSPEVRAWLDRTSSQDVLLKAAELAWRVLSGVALFPLAGFWIIPPLIWVVLFYAFVGEEGLELKRVKVALGIAIVLYMGAKLVLPPGFLLYVPFLNQVPPQFSAALILGVPLVIFALAFAAMCTYTRRTEKATLFRAFFVFALTDALLSLAIYAPSFFGGS